MPKKPMTVADDADESPSKNKGSKIRKGRAANVEKPTKKSKLAKSSKKIKATEGKRTTTTPPKGAVNPFAAVLRGLRKKLGKTTRDFAEEAGFSHGPAIARLESAEYFGTSVATMLRIADAVGGELVISIKLGK